MLVAESRRGGEEEFLRVDRRINLLSNIVRDWLNNKKLSMILCILILTFCVSQLLAIAHL